MTTATALKIITTHTVTLPAGGEGYVIDHDGHPYNGTLATRARVVPFRIDPATGAKIADGGAQWYTVEDLAPARNYGTATDADVAAFMREHRTPGYKPKRNPAPTKPRRLSEKQFARMYTDNVNSYGTPAHKSAIHAPGIPRVGVDAHPLAVMGNRLDTTNTDKDNAA